VELREELPFPTKLVTVHMSGRVIRDAVLHSRTDGAPDVEKRGFLQCDDRMQVHAATGLATAVAGPSNWELYRPRLLWLMHSPTVLRDPACL